MMLHMNPSKLEAHGAYDDAHNGARDYALVARAVAYLTENAREQPGLDDVAAHVGLSRYHFQRLFTRWAGISPKAFVQALTLEHARYMLRDSASVLDAAYEVGLSGPGRLHDLFVTFEAMSPGAYKSGGAGLEMTYGFHDSPFGMCLAIVTKRGLAGLAFADEHEAPGQDGPCICPQGRLAALADMKGRWPNARFFEDPGATSPHVQAIFGRGDAGRRDLNIVFIGTDFDISVWRTLMKIPQGAATTYSDIARHLGNPKAARAVGSAVGRNPISFLVPCHRVLRKSGHLGGYHWGLARKQVIIGWEAAPFRTG
ncbi:ADA regulatory protein / Methylated-DNA--protein-cysteine methyltransferase [hydrothermal vent metagenome]|uniref:methylated-DNA--[protein]-cysteine S-methyltransferase n=1 Tax=hydrothermal vent metagenome TaxID=652676 RepID=A0A3B0TPW9_9ZZZZ